MTWSFHSVASWRGWHLAHVRGCSELDACQGRAKSDPRLGVTQVRCPWGWLLHARAGGFLLSPLITQVNARTDLFAWPLALMLVSHGVSFVGNFIVKGEFRAVSAPQMMMRPYGRVVVLHVSIVLGGFLALSVGPSMGVLLLFVLTKIVVDVAAQLREDRSVEARTRSEPVDPAVAARFGD